MLLHYKKKIFKKNDIWENGLSISAKYFFNWAIPGLFFIYFCLFNTVFNSFHSKKIVDDWIQTSDLCGQSYKASTIVIYDSRVIPDLKIPHFTTLEL